MADPDEPLNGGASYMESWDDEPACTFDPGNGFAINQRSLDTLRWYAYLRDLDEDDKRE
jgi:hypothetical protein